MPLDRIPDFDGPIPGRPYRERPGSYALIRDASGRVAVMQSPRGCFLPGGGSDPGETPEETLIREVREECGRDLIDLRFLGRARQFIEAGSEGSICKDGQYFSARFSGPAASGFTAEPGLIFAWLSPAEAMKRMVHASQRWAISSWILATPPPQEHPQGGVRA